MSPVTQVGLHAVVQGADASGCLNFCQRWCVIKAYHADRGLFTVRTDKGAWLQFAPAALLVAAAPLTLLGVRA